MKNVKNHPHRDGFDLSRKVAFSAKLGELLPVLVEDVMPGDKFKISSQWFTRTQPVTSPAYCRFGEYYDFFFVPYHLLWRYFPDFVIQTNDDNWSYNINSSAVKFTQHPYFSSSEVLGFINKTIVRGSGDNVVSRYINDFNGQALSYGAMKLLEYLGYGKFNALNVETTSEKRHVYVPASNASSSFLDTALNPFPLAAYQKIYYDFYRNSQWEAPNPSSYNFDYLNIPGSMKVPISTIDSGRFGDCIFTLRYCNANKDYFLGRLPEMQYGDEAIASPLVSSFSHTPVFFNLLKGNDSTSSNVLSTTPLSSSGKPVDKVVSAYTDPLNDPTARTGIGALAIRLAEYLQKYREIKQSGGTDYVSQVQKMFGVTPSHEMAHRSTYIGGFSQKFGIQDVVNTNLSGSSPEATLMGKGENGGNGFVSFDVKEHGIIMGIYHVSVLPEYTSKITDKFNMKTQFSDYVIPVLDNVGMQPIPMVEAVGALDFSHEVAPTADVYKAPIGYVPRYAEYKTKVDKVLGSFDSGNENWVSPFNRINNPAYSSGSLSYDKFYKIDPRLLNSVFAVNVDSTLDTDQFLVNCYFDVKAVRNISRDGLPY